jgi:hypothetical protein
VLDEGTTFIFGSWICVADGLGGFNSHQANSKEPEATSSTPSSDLDNFIDNLDDMMLPDLARQIKKCPFLTRLLLVTHQIYSGRIQTDLKRPHDLSPSPTWRRIWICCSRSRTWAPPLAGMPSFSTSTRIPTKSTPYAVLHLEAGSKKDSEMREPLLVRRPPPSKTTRNPMATPKRSPAASGFNCHINTARMFHVLEGL